MRLSRTLVVAAVCMVCVLPVPRAAARGPSTSEERAKVVQLARLLERDPLHGNAEAAREWLHKWIKEVPDVSVSVCPDLLAPALSASYPYSRELDSQMAFSAAAFAIEHPEKGRNDTAQYIVGVEGALRAYEALVRSRPDARSAILDDLLAKRDHGELDGHIVALTKEKCKKPNRELIAFIAGSGVGLLLGVIVARWFYGRASRHSIRTARIAQRIVFACAAYYVLALGALHVLEPEFDPRFRFMSEYVWGAYGWIMVTTFFVLGLAALTVAKGLRDVHQSSWSARIGFGLLVVAGLFVCLAGVFKDFIPHLAASAVAIPGILMAALVLSWSFRRAAGWQAIYAPALLIALGMIAAFLAIMSHIGPPGLEQRALIGLFLVWLSIVARQLVRVTASAE